MIYKNSYFKKELRQAYLGNKISTNRKLASALFLGLFSFALYFVFQTLQESVLSDVVPEIMQPSFFSTLYLYIHISVLFNSFYFILYYDYLFFSEIRKNSWYLLIQMGYQPVIMFFSKFLALMYSVLLIYTVGFIVTVVLTFLLKYTFIIAYLPSLYFVGLADLFLVTILSMTFSLFAKTIINGRYWAFLSLVLIFILKLTLGQYNIISNRVAMQNFYNLFDLKVSVYWPVTLVIITACGLICLFRSRNLAKYYNVPSYSDIMPANVQLAEIDPKTGKEILLGGKLKSGWRSRIVDTVATVFLIIFICGALGFNLLIILINASTPGQEVSIRGVIPFVFNTNTMEPEIMINDLAYFQKVDVQYPINEGQVILFEDKNVLYVERVVAKTDNQLTVDIDNYPPMSLVGAMKKTITRQDVHGIYTGRNRWLGALILFANTIVGRILFLLVPTVLLFYQGQIYKYLKKEK
ncbi:Peptidase S24-like protein [Desulfosporosinus orientis DSM 765]|uniref:Peptidase S24-like protein n=1 Tax=Desulfosporosinus orientis (strain ATCC 19365 / DSM 765 / NCIMB 8382 / VKM B-1628 / Singapore I) TaxID=768706 RepID=G7W644_DESOD|nr:peptidase S24 [Desulfosporosinus orientis]AET67706.1 Peptidase S24-like protein [Desulfosporosinus orientis DSM 765]